MSIPNSLTILRIALTPLFVVLLFSSSSVLNEVALAVYIIAALTDWYDGWVARRYGYVSRWGKFLDPLADKVLAAAALLSFVYLRLVPVPLQRHRDGLRLCSRRAGTRRKSRRPCDLPHSRLRIPPPARSGGGCFVFRRGVHRGSDGEGAGRGPARGRR